MKDYELIVSGDLIHAAEKLGACYELDPAALHTLAAHHDYELPDNLPVYMVTPEQRLPQTISDALVLFVPPDSATNQAMLTNLVATAFLRKDRDLALEAIEKPSLWVALGSLPVGAATSVLLHDARPLVVAGGAFAGAVAAVLHANRHRELEMPNLSDFDPPIRVVNRPKPTTARP